MKFSENWLREWVNPDVGTEKLCEQLTMAGLEVDGVEAAAEDFSGVVVAEILEARQHPDADKLQVCTVSNGTENVEIVCGAPNARTGIKVACAEVGAVLPGNFKIKKAKLRGVVSMASSCNCGSTPLSYRWDASVCKPYCLALPAMASGLNQATSSNTSTVSSAIPLCSPPIIPAKARGLW